MHELIQSISIQANELTFHALAAGPDGGPLVVLLHGFPELALSWRHQLRALGNAGYRAVAPDQRGYGRTTRRGPYDTFTLSDDIAALIAALGRQTAIIVGHDWGGGVAWTLAQRHPEVVEKLVVANCPPPSVMARSFLKNPAQLRKSWYMFFFQIPFLPEWWLSRNGAAAVAKSLIAGTNSPTAFSAMDLAQYQDAFSDRRAARAAVDWYRQAMRHPLRARELERVKVSAPTLVLWGQKDRFIGQELIEGKDFVDVFSTGNTARIEYLANAGHFVQNESPKQFNALLLDWLAEK